MITKENLRQILEVLGFNNKENKDIYNKEYNNGALISVNFLDEKIIYPSALNTGDNTTTNFSHNENFVVLECVDRLLSIGYAPSHIFLEPEWKLGHLAKSGKADILVKDRENKSYLIIECKTSGDEYNFEIKNMENNGGQLFSYLQQEKNTDFICLYSVDFIQNKINRSYYAIDVREQKYKKAGNAIEMHSIWLNEEKKAQFSYDIFEESILTPYKIKEQRPTITSLKLLPHSEFQKKYNEFATILRKHNISGRENAFDKLLNLFLCKVIDEKNNPNGLKFNYLGNRYDDIYNFCDRLQELYQQGMDKYLNTKISYVSDAQIEQAFRFIVKDPDATKNTVKKLFRELKYYTNNDFSFIEVYNEELFKKNSEILKEMVQMFADIHLTNSEQNQFLGDFFEGFLDKGIKQSEGQFFTPLPIVKFIISSLPIKEMLENNPELKVIDYACGSGHFLNEYANYIKNFITDKELLKLNQKGIYGIEKETRLAKVAKVASFMYNQEINIHCEDALTAIRDIKNESFNILIANPPYSVKGFLETLSEEERKKFKLYEYVNKLDTNNSIECFFIERAAQLVAENGVCGIIVPSSLINKGGIYQRTREILLSNFEIIAISEFGSQTFGQTGTNTIILFLRKYKKSPYFKEVLDARSEHIFNNNELNSVYEDEKELLRYCQFMNYDYNSYLDFLNGKIKAEEIANETFAEYLKAKYNFNKIKEIEREKFIYFILCEEQKIFISQTPSENKEQKLFLGYEWSNKKGSEGIKYLNSKNSTDDEITDKSNELRSINTALYDPAENPNNSSSFNQNKINYWIRKSFVLDKNSKNNLAMNLNNSEISKFSKFIDLIDCINFKKADFDLAINLSVQTKIKFKSKYPLIKLEYLCDMYQPKTITSAEIQDTGKYKVYGANGIIGYYDKFNHKNSVIAMACRGVCGIINITEPESWITGNAMVIIPLDKEKLLETYLKHILILIDKKSIITGSVQPQITRTNLKELEIPLPPVEIQQLIANECENLDKQIELLNNEIEQKENKFNQSLDYIKQYTQITKSLKSVAEYTTKRINYQEILAENYITTDNILQNYAGIRKYEEIPNINSVIEYKANDILISNIRPYLKKIWFSNRDGGCNADVLVIRIKPNIGCLAKYIFYCLRQDEFFDYSMQNVKGLKMPRGNKDHIMDYVIPLPSLDIQQKIVVEFEKLELEIAENQEKIKKLKNSYKEILDKYLKE